MAIQPTNCDLAFKTFEGRSMMRLTDLRKAGVTSVTLCRMQDAGEIVKLARGVYQIAEADYTAERSLAEAALRVPNGVVCLVSALAHHGLTNQMPSKVWMAIGHKAWAPTTSSAALRIVRFADNFLADGVDIVVIEDVIVRIFGVAKTIADSFRHRRSVGLAVALEGLQEALHQRKTTASEILAAAARGRVGTIVRPYLTAMTVNG